MNLEGGNFNSKGEVVNLIESANANGPPIQNLGPSATNNNIPGPGPSSGVTVPIKSISSDQSSNSSNAEEGSITKLFCFHLLWGGCLVACVCFVC